MSDSSAHGSGTSRYHAALEIAAQIGWRLFPLHWPTATGARNEQRCSCGNSNCKAIGKHPLTAHGFKDATRDFVAIDEWWEKWPDANIGVPTGSVNGIIALDIDPRNGGDESLEELVRLHAPLPDTVEAITGGGGRHILFAHPGGEIRGRPIAPGVDVKGDGGYVVVESSLHASGNCYAWEWSSHPDDVDLAPVPEWLLELIRGQGAAPATPVSSQDDSAGEQGAIAEGYRNSRLTSLAGAMRRQGADADTIYTALVAFNQAHCTPPLDATEVERIAKGMMRYEPVLEDGWSPPTPLVDTASAPTFPIAAAFPAGLADIREYLQGLAHELQVPLDLPAMLLPPVVAASISQKFVVEVRDGWREIAALWTMSVLESGERKSGTLRRMTDPVLEWERSEAERLAPEIAEATERRKVLERMRDRARKDACDDPEAQERAIDFARQLAEQDTIEAPSLVLTDVTSEALIEMMVNNGERALIATPEADALDVMMGRYDEKSRPNFGIWLKGYTGDRVRVLRKGRGPEFLERPALSVAIAVQPEAVRGLLSNRAARGRGLLARFLWSLPPGMVGHRVIGAPPVDEPLQMAYEAAVRRLLNIAVERGMGPRVVRLEPRAAKTFTEFETAVERDLGRGGGLSDQRDWGAKLCGAIARIALVLHCLEHHGRGSARSANSAHEIGEATMEAAIAWAPYLAAHERLARGITGCCPDVAVAERILRWLERTGEETFTRRDCFTAVRGEFVRKAHDVDQPLALLADLGYVRTLPPPDTLGRSGRKPSPGFVVNPLWERGGGQ